MKFSKLAFDITLIASIFFAVVSADDGHDHEDDHEDALECADYNVTDLVSCHEWCGDNYTAAFNILSEHGASLGGTHLNYFEGIECECEPESIEAESRAVSNSTEEMHCVTLYELPTCESVGLADCGDNATYTCDELCYSLGLTSDGDSNVCVHEEAEDDHDHRFLQDDHNHTVSYTMCFCDAVNAGDGLMVCADDDWEDEDHSHDDDHDEDDDEDAAYLPLALSSTLLVLLLSLQNFM